MEVAQYSGGVALVLWGIPSVLWSLFITVGDNFSTVESIQCIGLIPSIYAGGLNQ